MLRPLHLNESACVGPVRVLSGVPGKGGRRPLTRTDGRRRASLSRSFRSGRVIHPSESLLSFRLSDATSPTDGWLCEHSAFTLRLHPGAMRRHLLKRCPLPRCGRLRASAAHKTRLRQPPSGRPAVSAAACLTETSDLFRETSAGRQKKKKKTSAEMWSHAARAHYKWFLSAGEYLLVPPSPAVFSCKLPLKLLLSVAII